MKKCYNLIYGKLRYTISYQSYSQLIIWIAFRSVKLLIWDQCHETINIKQNDTAIVKNIDGNDLDIRWIC